MVIGRHHGLPQGPRDHRRGLSCPARGHGSSSSAWATATPSRSTHREGIAFEVENPTRLAVTGIDKELVGHVAARVRADAQARALQGQGRPLRGRGHPPQGRQGRQDRRQEVAPAARARSGPTPSRPVGRHRPPRTVRRRATSTMATGRTEAPRAASATPASACTSRGPPARPRLAVFRSLEPDLRPGHRRHHGSHARERLVAGGTAARERPAPRSSAPRKVGVARRRARPGRRHRAGRLRPCRVPLSRADQGARRWRARIRPRLLEKEPRWHGSIPAS